MTKAYKSMPLKTDGTNQRHCCGSKVGRHGFSVDAPTFGRSNNFEHILRHGYVYNDNSWSRFQMWIGIFRILDIPKPSQPNQPKAYLRVAQWHSGINFWAWNHPPLLSNWKARVGAENAPILHPWKLMEKLAPHRSLLVKGGGWKLFWAYPQVIILLKSGIFRDSKALRFQRTIEWTKGK